MKRFYETAEAVAGDAGYEVRLDGRTARTPARKPLALPGAALAEAVAEEWRAQSEEVLPEAMPLTRIAATALDILPDRRAVVIAEIAGYAETDLVCHRVDHPADLARRQHEGWQPLLDWLAEHHGARLLPTTGILPADQPAESVAVLEGVVAAHGDLALAALQTLTTACGSLVIALAVAGRRVSPGVAWSLSRIDEDFQAERWGEDAEAAGRASRRRDDFMAAARVLTLSETPPAS